MNGKQRPTGVVTGASAGIGRETAKDLAALGWNVIGVGRDPARSASAGAEIRASAAPGATVSFVRGDFTLMTDVKRIANEILSQTDRLDVLINNAGGVRDKLYTTEEGTEATFAANHLAPFVLTRELEPLLKKTATSAAPGTVRVIAVSSSAHRAADGLDWDDLQSFNCATASEAYCRVKLANILYTRELARRLSPDGVIAQVMHPGRVDSNFASHGDAQMQAYMAAAETVAPTEPAETLIWLATSAEAGHTPGRYFHKLAEETPTDAAQDDATAKRLWLESEALLAKIGV